MPFYYEYYNIDICRYKQSKYFHLFSFSYYSIGSCNQTIEWINCQLNSHPNKCSYKKNISGKTIQFIINGTNIGSAVTNSNGIATLSYTITQNAGYYYITTIFAGDNIYSYSNGGATLKVPHSNIYIAAINSTKPIANSECIPMEPTGVPIIPLFVGALMMVAGITNNKRKN